MSQSDLKGINEIVLGQGADKKLNQLL